MKKRTKLIRVTAAPALAAALLCGTASLPTAIHADAPAVSIGFPGGQAIKAPMQKPLWTSAVDPGSKAAVTDYGTVLAFSGKKLIALNLATGKKVFTYGSNLKPSVQYLKGMAYGVGDDGHVYAMNAKTGKELWKSAAGLSDADEPIVIGDTVYVANKQALIALDAATGKQRWKSVEDRADTAGKLSLEAEGILFMSNSISGAYSYSQLKAIDEKTGKTLWKAPFQAEPFAVRDGLVYSEKEQSPFDEVDADGPPHVTLSVLNVKTGNKVGERVYSWNRTNSSPSAGVAGSMLLSGNDLYLVTEDAIHKYDFGHYDKDGKPLKKWNKPSYPVILTGSVHAGRIYFWNYNTNSISGMKLVDGQEIQWGTDNPPVRTDIYGNGVYIGQSDGVFHGYNLQTTAPAFTVNTGSRNYGPTLRSSNTLIIQAQDNGKLIAVPVPKALQ
ncbi:PQQ-binding-like beta-propeller repeat protein [Paenibacillus sp. VCA1]|uniref:outer membrane protein assembly factor BamB family protein n=1 Tax=Paenibacillus sp. VCA1 TaxID=3039148 RepID=UPI002871BFAC|nr:PQQ-binding-like beta-propeller repeat protein [Paenibacillus sp. VCA1]MDR9852360.1 PQQ-binding-like beta-propeller repeat protein [Paenibacillus sp. VCA1]